jgi:glycosyltransferase involved in cell wall biosynthesis
MIPAHDPGPHLRTALESVLAQDPGPAAMQVTVVDDGSTEDLAAVARECAGDRVDVVRHARNLGHVRTFNACLERSRGRFVHLLHADDAVLPGFYDRLAAGLDRDGVGAAFCRYTAVNGAGKPLKVSDLERVGPGVLPGWLRKIAVGQRLQPPCIAVRREVYERLGGFDTRIRSYGEDWEMWTRIAAHYDVWFEPEPLALYRVEGPSLSHSAVRSGDNVRQLVQVIELNRDVLPHDEAEELTRAALRETAVTAIRRARRLAEGGEYRAASRQLAAGLAADRSRPVLARLGRALLGLAALRVRYALRPLSRRRGRG